MAYLTYLALTMNRSPKNYSTKTCLEILSTLVQMMCCALVLQNMQLVHHGPGKLLTFLEASLAVEHSGGKNAELTYFDSGQPRAAWPVASFPAAKELAVSCEPRPAPRWPCVQKPSCWTWKKIPDPELGPKLSERRA